MRDATQRFPLGRLLVISGATFSSTSSEFLPAGVLTEIATDMNVSEAQVGLLVSVFALTVAVSTLPLTAVTRAIPRKTLMIVLLVGLAATNLVCAIAPDYEVLLGARIFGGLCHGLFWSVATPYASYLVRQDHLARALTVVNGGTTIGFILGVPLGTAIGVALGWRAAFAVTGGVILCFAVLVAVFLPSVNHRGSVEERAEQPHPLRDRTLGPVLVIGLIVVFAALGQYSFFTYIAPWILGPAGLSEELLSPMLSVFGLAGAVGLVVAGFAGDRRLTATTLVVLATTAASVVVLYFFATGPIAVALCIAFWGIAFAGFPSLVQALALNAASRGIHDFAGAIITVSFNAAISIGALIGGVVIENLGAVALPWSQFVFTLIALAFALVALIWVPRRQKRAPVNAHDNSIVKAPDEKTGETL